MAHIFSDHCVILCQLAAHLKNWSTRTLNVTSTYVDRFFFTALNLAS